MTRERAKELLPVFQAWAEGKEVQVAMAGTEDWKHYGQPSPLSDPDRLSDPNFENPNWKWRVKPEAREWDMFVTREGILKSSTSERGLELIRVREIL